MLPFNRSYETSLENASGLVQLAMAKGSKLQELFTSVSSILDATKEKREALEHLLPKVELDAIFTSLLEVEKTLPNTPVGLAQAALLTFGIEVKEEKEPGTGRSIRNWELSENLPQSEDIRYGLRQLAARNKLYDIPGSIGLLDWLDEGVEDGAVVVPLGEGIILVRHIGDIRPRHVTAAIKEFNARGGKSGLLDSSQGVLVVIEDYSELRLRGIDTAGSAGLATSSADGIDAPTIPVPKTYRADKIVYMAIGMQFKEGLDIFHIDTVEDGGVVIWSDRSLGLGEVEDGSYVNGIGPIARRKRVECALIVAKELVEYRSPRK